MGGPAAPGSGQVAPNEVACADERSSIDVPQGDDVSKGSAQSGNSRCSGPARCKRRYREFVGGDAACDQAGLTAVAQETAD